VTAQPPPPAAGDRARPGTTTGRWVVVFADVEADHTSALGAFPGVTSVADSREFADGVVDTAQTGGADATVFAELGIAVVRADPSDRSTLGRARERGVLSVSPELVHHVLTDRLPDPGYVRGYRDGVDDLAGRLLPGGAGPVAEPRWADTAEATWGLQATRVLSSPATGRGVRVAVLDTGLDLSHPDFADRDPVVRSFVDGERAQDGQGHGTHCAGTACGPLAPGTGPRYGVAHEAELLVGKVLGDDGSGTDAGILAGINWAVLQGCAVVSMSLGADVPQVHPPYTTAGRRALDRGTLLVAAAGNNAEREGGGQGFVGPPASSPYVMAVAALDPALGVTDFSARTLLDTRGGQVDVAGPGLDVLSAWLAPERYATLSGTSMATPHVAGLAALWAQSTGQRGRELWATLLMESERLTAASLDVGGGLVLAPQQR